MSESLFGGLPRTNQTQSPVGSTFDSAVSIDFGRASEVVRALRSVFAVGELTRVERESLRVLVVRYMCAVRRHEIPPERALVFVKELARQAQTAQDRCEPAVSALTEQSIAIQMFDCREYYADLTRQIIGWSIDAYYGTEHLD